MATIRRAMDDETLVRLTEQSANAGGAVAQTAFRTSLDVTTKDGKTDFVTETDRNAQAAVTDCIHEQFPDDPIYGEEDRTLSELPETGRVWIIDPIDGTNNYIRGNPCWVTSVACVVDGEPVAAANVMPAVGDRYVATPDGVTRNGVSVSVSKRTDPDLFDVAPIIWWSRERREEYAAATRVIVTQFGDLRRFGSAQFALSLVAAGGIDGVITNVETKAWDTVAGVAMIRWAGGTVTDLNGNPWRHDSRGLVASNGTQHDRFVEATEAIETVREKQ